MSFTLIIIVAYYLIVTLQLTIISKIKDHQFYLNFGVTQGLVGPGYSLRILSYELTRDRTTSCCLAVGVTGDSTSQSLKNII